MTATETSVLRLLDDYDGFLLDAFGVLCTMDGAVPGAGQMVDALRNANRPFRVITNDASSLPENTAAALNGFGVKVSPHEVITAGSLLSDYFERHDLKDSRCLVLGTDATFEYVRRAGGQARGPGDSADPPEIIVVGREEGYPFPEGMHQTVTLLFAAIDAGRAPRLLLPNPDVIYPRGPGRFGITAGAVAALIEAAIEARYPGSGMCFEPLGKPSPGLFEAGRRLIGVESVVMIGDQPQTDVAGALAAGIDVALAGTGLTDLEGPWRDHGYEPTWLLPSLETP